MCSPFQQWCCCVWGCCQQGLGRILWNSKGHLGSELWLRAGQGRELGRILVWWTWQVRWAGDDFKIWLWTSSVWAVILVLFSTSSLQREGEQCGDHHPEPTDYLKTMRVDRMTRETHVHRTANGRCRGEIREQSGKSTFCTLKFRPNSQQKRCWRNLRSIFWQQGLSGLSISWQIPLAISKTLSFDNLWNRLSHHHHSLDSMDPKPSPLAGLELRLSSQSLHQVGVQAHQ